MKFGRHLSVVMRFHRIGPPSFALSPFCATLPTVRGPTSIRFYHSADPLKDSNCRTDGHRKNDDDGRSVDRELLLNVLNASTTRRDAKSYLSRFTGENKSLDNVTAASSILHLALVVVRDPGSLNDAIIDGIAQTLSQLARLGLLSAIVFDRQAGSTNTKAARLIETQQCDRLVAALRSNKVSARRLDYVLGVSTQDAASVRRSVSITLSSILLETLRRGKIPVIPSIAYTTDDQCAVAVDANDVMLAMVKHFVGPQTDFDVTLHADKDESNSDFHVMSGGGVNVDRVIVLDPLGGLPSQSRADKAHIFVNLGQECKEIRAELSSANEKQHARNLTLAHDCLSLLPPLSSALLTTPEEAATLTSSEHLSSYDIGVITRRPKNPLIFNLLTDKPTVSSSLPVARFNMVGSDPGMLKPTPTSATFFKRGMPVTMIPDPRIQPWRPPYDTKLAMSLDDPRIDFGRLLNLIEDSFDRPLDVEDYVNRIRNKLAGIIVAGTYEGGALLTWELPPDVPDDGSEESCRRMVPYLDKFAVLKRSQGSGGVADIVFSAMVRTCFPDGVCWRSRKNNPVNKWYFERSTGSWKLNDSPWSMFWTTPNLFDDEQKFLDYESVCRTVQPSWASEKHIVD